MLNKEPIESPIEESSFFMVGSPFEIGEMVSYAGELYIVMNKDFRIRTIFGSASTLEIYDLLTLRPLTLEADIEVDAVLVESCPLLR